MLFKKELLLKAINASISGGHAIMEIYNSDFSVEYKEDNSPLTLADKNCNAIIEKELKETVIPIISEEGAKIPYKKRKHWEYCWIVDPLDGTKEFVKRNGEFTVNIALIHNGSPIMGVIFVPEKEKLYYSLEGLGSFKVITNTLVDNLDSLIIKSTSLPIRSEKKRYTMVGSRSHMSNKTEEFFNLKKSKYPDIDIIIIGSSLKLCMVAEGKADSYPRYAPTMEWDTAAGHAIVKTAGFSVLQYNTNKEVVYNKENLLNPWFLVE
ncbi:MAG: 3'(2'),5'-bisphosphate nucleotidase CysQ [Bacteroidota bacterium]|nr:3'(2'),5'-bisphosphate nucleotidase CysQ [Bacteroidota bacterium]